MELKTKIVNSAFDLFAEKGYEKTTVSEIIKMAGSSKGGFYHHFKSKEEILEALTMNYMNDVLSKYKDVFENHQGTVVELFNKFIASVNDDKTNNLEERAKLKKVFSINGNYSLMVKLSKQMESVTTEFYERIIRLGIENKEFDVEYPNLLAGLWTRQIFRVNGLINKMIFDDSEVDFERINEMLDYNEKLLNRELGLEGIQIKFRKASLGYLKKARGMLGKE